MAKILLVDDDAVLSRMFSTAFSNDGYVVETAMDGEEGLEKLKIFQPDLVITDIMMPRIDGIEFLKKIKEGKSSKNTKVIVMTNLKDDDNAKKASDLGALEHVLKNETSPSQFVEIVHKHLPQENSSTP